MSTSHDQRHIDVEEAQATLQQGLNACRAVLRGYRELMADDSGSLGPHQSADNDDDSSAHDDLN